MPMWQEIFDELHLEPYYVLSVRHPEAVAASLQKRDRVDVSHAQAIWLKTNLEIMSHLGNKLRSVVDYDRWFDSGLDQGRALANSLQLIQPPDETLLAEAIDRVIRPGLRHHYGNQEVICSPTVEKFYFLLRHAAIDGKIPDEVAQILSTFEKSLDLLNIWDTLVVERDAIIAQNDLKIRRMKKQKNVLLYLVFALPALILALSAFFAWRFWH
ncbi:MAG: hypothetical protein P4L55_10795 [Syntrophobacteraceae bacterium]|nr:hypothetical protein [Syntrophobacteraceae bacterium]